MGPSATRFWISVATPLFAVLAGGLLLGGCKPLARHARTAYDTAGLHLERTGWDTLHVTPRFVRRTSLGQARRVQPETTFVQVFGAGYDTLYTGPAAGPIPVPDRQLASREPLLVEACGAFERDLAARDAGSPSGPPSPRVGEATRTDALRTLCEQTTIFASPKRVRATASDIAFPEGADFQRGRYEVRFVAERRAFQDTTWEPLEGAAAPRGYLLARVESAGGQGSVHLPLGTEGQGRFNLARHAGYDDFRYHLRSSMERSGAGRRVDTDRRDEAPPAAVVAFEVQASLNGAPPQPVSRTRKEVRRFTPEERRRHVQLFAQSAAQKIAGHLGAGHSVLPEEWEDARATVRGWRYDRLRGGRYEIDLRVRWHEGDAGGRYKLEGVLTVEDGSRQARFTGKRGNRRTVRRWRRVVDSDELSLGTLEEPRRDGDPEESALAEIVPPPERRDLANRRPSRRRYEPEPRERGQYESRR